MTGRDRHAHEHVTLPGRSIRVRRSGCEPIDIPTHPASTVAMVGWLCGTCSWPTTDEWRRMMEAREAVVL
jgi:hypothetical protein